MRETVIHIPSFQGAYKTGLIFSLIEGLREGERFRLVCDQNPVELTGLLREARLSNLKWNETQVNEARWEVLIEKTL